MQRFGMTARTGMTARFVLRGVYAAMAQCIGGHELGAAPTSAPEQWSLASCFEGGTRSRWSARACLRHFPATPVTQSRGSSIRTSCASKESAV